MRETKYRAWVNNRMVYSDAYEQLSFFFRYLEAKQWLNYEVILMQTIGLKDQNGVQIYEDDLVVQPTYLPREGISDNPQKLPQPKIVDWNESLLGWNISPSPLYTILGNKWQHPELLI